MTNIFKLSLFICPVLILSGCLQYLAYTQIRAYELREKSPALAVRAMHNYFSFTNFLPFGAIEHAVISNAFNIARLETAVKTDQFGNGGAALKHLIPLIKNTKPGSDKWRALAAYEALVILTALPWDSEIALLADEAAKVLNTELLLTSASSTDDERQLANRILLIYQSRSSAGSELQAMLPTSATNKENWIIGFTEVRSSLARCMNVNGRPTDAAKEAIKTGFGFNWLSAEAFDGWDNARVTSVKLANTSAECFLYAEQVGKIINLISKE